MRKERTLLLFMFLLMIPLVSADNFNWNDDFSDGVYNDTRWNHYSGSSSAGPGVTCSHSNAENTGYIRLFATCSSTMGNSYSAWAVTRTKFNLNTGDSYRFDFTLNATQGGDFLGMDISNGTIIDNNNPEPGGDGTTLSGFGSQPDQSNFFLILDGGEDNATLYNGTRDVIASVTLQTNANWFVQFAHYLSGTTGSETNEMNVNNFTSMDWGIILSNPTEGESVGALPITFNSTVNIFNETLQNATLHVWNSTGSPVNITTNSLSNFETESSSWSVDNLLIDEYTWNVFACGVSICDWANSNSTFILGLQNNNFTFSESVLETSDQTFTANITIPSGFTIQSTVFNYNGTNYTGGSRTNTAGSDWDISNTLTIPPGTQGFSSENRSFFWHLTINNVGTGELGTFVTDINNQTVTELSFGLCNPTRNVPMLNFTMKDEITGSDINAVNNATTFQATFTLGASSSNKLKNFTINNQTVNTAEFDFCTDDAENILFTDMESFYTAVGYTDKNYFLSNATLTNVTSEIDLFLLPDATGVQFFVTVEQDLFPVSGVIVQVAKFFTGEGIYKTVEIEETDSSGKFTSYLELDKKYRFTIIRDGNVLDIIDRTATCEAAPCELTLSISGDAENPYSGFESAFASNVVYNLSYNSVNQIVTFDFVDTTGLATSFRMEVIRLLNNQTNVVVFNKRVFTSSGSMTFNATNLSNGDYRVNTYISRSPDLFIDLIDFVINTAVAVFGNLGLFLALALILVVIFSFAVSPVMMIMAVPVSLSIAKSANLLLVGNGVITLVYIMAVIFVVILMRRG